MNNGDHTSTNTAGLRLLWLCASALGVAGAIVLCGTILLVSLAGTLLSGVSLLIFG